MLYKLRKMRQARRDREEAAVMGWLALQGPASGWDIAVGTHMGVSRVYACLDRLRAAGRITSCWDPQISFAGRPRQLLYDVTQTPGGAQ